MRFGTHNSKLLRPPYSRISSPLYTFPGPYPLFPHSSYEATTTLHVTHTYTVLYHRRGISLDKRPSAPKWSIFLRLMHPPLTTVSYFEKPSIGYCVFPLRRRHSYSSTGSSKSLDLHGTRLFLRPRESKPGRNVVQRIYEYVSPKLRCLNCFNGIVPIFGIAFLLLSKLSKKRNCGIFFKNLEIEI